MKQRLMEIHLPRRLLDHAPSNWKDLQRYLQLPLPIRNIAYRAEVGYDTVIIYLDWPGMAGTIWKAYYTDVPAGIRLVRLESCRSE